jgi:hypothetical protein
VSYGTRERVSVSLERGVGSLEVLHVGTSFRGIASAPRGAQVLDTRLKNPKGGSPKPLELVCTSPLLNDSRVRPHDEHKLHQGYGTTHPH